ncbi:MULTISPECIES: DinB family protein [unclassified Rhodococcus (in: high G+C Gram-positive bacteria)]|uniref:DinB family protein n=1 Tax=unclassified Rhodococcus (in: high G+C Gram-positive bacteria) TaxID=192944 RepID=UPI00163A0F34|nr:MULTISPECIES: DinB family protein [unclassified Rhodococcus (in: high G+C Gram-positive bacteria)]MBC2642765.1 DinB family protein [Rhodococcus sp. 3A]MBC2892493.1 DinB family protein [Rhodococcus sp. 4CII]
MTTSQQSTATGERADILQILQEQRATLLITVRGIDDAQARQRSTVSDLTLGGLIKHVLHTEKHWVETILEPDENAEFDMEWAMEKYYMRDDETLEGLLAEYAEVARATETAVAGLDDLDVLIPLPTAPWAPERQWWTIRRTLLHIIRETGHHSGHADIIRESLDGGNTTMQMGADAGMEF